MALIVEDGSIVANANSYISLADARTYLATLGYSLSADDVTAEQELVRAYDYVNSFEGSYQGYRVDSAQTGSFPRYDVYLNNFLVDSNEIPETLKQAQCLAAKEESSESGILSPSTTGQTVTSEEVVGAVKVSYADNGLDSIVSFTAIDAKLSGLFSGGGSSFRVLRV